MRKNRKQMKGNRQICTNLSVKFRCISGLSMLLFFLFFSSNSSAQQTDYKSYTLFVYNFIKYIEWPKAQKGGDFIIIVLGNSPVVNELKNLAATKKAHGQNIVVKQISTLDEIGNCQLLYIASSKSSSLKDIVEKTKNNSTLLIAEREGLAKKGAAINFVTLEDEGDLLKFEVNKKNIESRNLKIPGALMKLGFEVG